MSARVRQIHIPAEDDLRLAGTLHEPAAGGVRRTVVVSPAVGVWRSFYGPFASHLATRGFRAVTYDYRGMGESPAPPGGRGSIRMQDWGELDMSGVVSWAAGRWEAPLVVVGHSAGGQLFGLCREIQRVRGLVGIGAQSGYWRHWPLPRRWLIVLLWHVAIPALVPLAGGFPGRWFGLGADLPSAMARQWATWGRDPDYLRGAHAPESARRFDRYHGRVLACAVTDDRLYAPPPAVRAFLDFWPRARTRYVEISPAGAGLAEIGHFGFFRPEPGRRLWERAEEWIAGM